MKFKRKIETQYNHYICEDKIILGVPKELDETEVELLYENPMPFGSIITDVTNANISPVQRNNILDALEMYCNEKKEVKALNPFYWDIVEDFIFAIYGKTLFDLSKDLTEVCQGYTEKNIFDTLDKLKNSKGNPREGTIGWIRMAMAYCRISEDILKTGKGFLYEINDVSKYSLESIKEYIDQNDEFDLLDMLCKVNGIDEEEVVKIPLEIVCNDTMVGEDIEIFIKSIIKSMEKSRE